MSNHPAFLSPAQLAESLGIPEGTLANWRWKRIGPSFHVVGRHVRYSVADVEAWGASQRIECPIGGATSALS